MVDADKAIRLHIKGDRTQATEAANARGILLDFAVSRGTGHDASTTALCSEEYRTKVVYWMCEPSTAVMGEGFPPGTLLLHN